MGHGSLFSRQLEFPIYHQRFLDLPKYTPWSLKLEAWYKRHRQTLSQSIIHLEPGWGLQLLDIALPKAFDQSIVQTQVGTTGGGFTLNCCRCGWGSELFKRNTLEVGSKSENEKFFQLVFPDLEGVRKEIREEMSIIIGMTLEFEICLNWFRSFLGGGGVATSLFMLFMDAVWQSGVYFEITV